MRFRNPFNISPKKASIEDAMVALYGILHMHEKADGKPLRLPLADASFDMSYFNRNDVAMNAPRCGTAACAAGSAALSTWFHKYAEARGVNPYITVDTSRTGKEETIIEEGFVDNYDLWEDAYEDMNALFYGYEPAYVKKRPLEELTVDEVKAALRNIVFKHYGQKGLDRCLAMDQQSCITIK